MSTPVSALQEYAVKKKYTMPQYNTEPSDVLGYAFKCTVHVDKIIGIGYGSTKQSAKHQSATKALEQFGIGSKINDGNNNALKIASFSVPEPPRANTNYVGVLNELASTRGKPYPVYEDVQSLGPFKIQCSFLTWQTEGTGTQKKAAKQEAAQKMLQLAKTSGGVSSTEPVNNGGLVPIHKQEQLEELTQRAIKKIEEMSFTNPNVGLYEDVIPQIVANSPIKTLEELQDELRINGLISKIEIIQESPFIVMLRLEGHSCIVMGQGQTKKIAYTDLFESTLLMFIKNFNFRTHFEVKH